MTTFKRLFKIFVASNLWRKKCFRVLVSETFLHRLRKTAIDYFKVTYITSRNGSVVFEIDFLNSTSNKHYIRLNVRTEFDFYYIF